MAEKEIDGNKEFVFYNDIAYPKADFENPNFIDAHLVDKLLDDFEITYNLDVSGIENYIWGIDGNLLESPGEIKESMISFKPGIDDKEMRKEVVRALDDLRVALLHSGEEW